jgi:hypothetical protein
MFGNATTALRLVDAGCGLLCGGGGRLEENAAGSGGSINPGGGVESNKSLSINCAAGVFICKSRRGTLGVWRGTAGGAAGGAEAAGGALAFLAMAVATEAPRFRSSGVKGTSSATGSTSSVRSSPP